MLQGHPRRLRSIGLRDRREIPRGVRPRGVCTTSAVNLTSMPIEVELSDIVSRCFAAGIWIGERPEKDIIAVRLRPDITMPSLQFRVFSGS
jgi:hypothetical protein